MTENILGENASKFFFEEQELTYIKIGPILWLHSQYIILLNRSLLNLFLWYLVFKF